MHRLTNAVASVGRPLASKAMQRTFASSPVRSQKPVVRFYSTPATSVVAEPFLNGTSSTYVEEMYESWLENPSSVHKSWDIFFRNARDGAPPGSAYTSPPAIRPGSQAAAVGASSVAVATVPAAGAVVQPIPDVKLIDDHLAVQAIIRAYQAVKRTASSGIETEKVGSMTT